MAFFSFRQHGYRARQRGRPPTLLLKQQSSVAGLTIGRTRRRRARWGLWSILFLLLLRIQQWTIGNSFDFFDTQQLTLSPHGEPFANKVNNRQNLLSYIHKSNPRKDPDPKTIAKLQNAGLDMSSLDNETLQLIPEWSTIEDILGSSTPHILGLDTCQTFRSIVQNEPRYIGGKLMDFKNIRLVVISLILY